MQEAIGRLHHVVFDTDRPRELAAFYAALLGQAITFDDGDWVVVSRDQASSGLAFQRVEHHRRATWPDGDVPQQAHLDVMVDDVAVARRAAEELGARLLAGDGAGAVLEDPSGHPFCLVPRPGWAPPVASPR